VLTAAAGGGNVVVGGYEATSQAAARSDLAELDPHGRLQSFAPTFTGIIGSEVTAFAFSPDGKTLYIGGGFSTVDGQPRNDLAAFDVATGTLRPWRADALTGEVAALAMSPDGSTLYVGGYFDHLGADDQPRNALGAVSTATGDATGWNPQVVGSGVNALALSSDGATLYAGGMLMSAYGQARQNLTALSTAGGGAVTAWAPQPNSTVLAVAIGPDGTVFVGGLFSKIGSDAAARHDLAAISPAGTGAATGWNPTVTTSDSLNPSEVEALAVSADHSTLFVGGRFDQLGGQARTDLGEVSLSSGAATAWNPDPGQYLGTVDALEASGPTVRAGGGFQRMGLDGDQDYAQFTSLPASTARPTITGQPSYHKTLTCRPGTFSNFPLTVSYAWTRGGKPISRQTGATYRVQGADSGHALACQVTATNARGSAVATSASVTPGPYVSSFKLKRKRGHRYFKFSLSEKAKVTITISRLAPGRKRHGRCHAGSKHGHGAKCTTAVKVGAITGKGPAGAGKLVLKAKVGRRHLGAGRYEATITARDSGRRRSNRRTIKLSIG
jgi:hypothetical protein